MSEGLTRLRAVLLGVDLTLDGPEELLCALRIELAELLVADSGPAIVAAALTVRADSADPVGDALAAITAVAVSKSPRLCMHAGVVACADGVIALPGPSGLGKTTLVAALVQSGLGYLSDEVLAVDRLTQAVTAFPRPLSMSADSCRLLGLSPPWPPAGSERRIPRSDLGSLGPVGPVRHIVLPRRESTPVAASLERGRAGSAVEHLLLRAFNHFDDPATSYRSVVDLVRNAEVWDAIYYSATELADVVAGRFGVSGSIVAK